MTFDHDNDSSVRTSQEVTLGVFLLTENRVDQHFTIRLLRKCTMTQAPEECCTKGDERKMK